jgi:hypothetical protein
MHAGSQRSRLSSKSHPSFSIWCFSDSFRLTSPECSAIVAKLLEGTTHNANAVGKIRMLEDRETQDQGEAHLAARLGGFSAFLCVSWSEFEILSLPSFPPGHLVLRLLPPLLWHFIITAVPFPPPLGSLFVSVSKTSSTR